MTTVKLKSNYNMKTNNKQMKRITFTLPEPLENKLLNIQKQTGYTLSDLVRQGLELLTEKYK